MLKANVVIVGGDLTGKMLVPLVQESDGKVKYYLMGRMHVVESRELKKIAKEIHGMGYYPYVTDEGGVEELRSSRKKLEEVFVQSMRDTLNKWFDLIREKVPRDASIIVLPGNDDRFEIDDVIKSHEDVIYAEGEVIDLDGVHELVSCGWVNPTPWKTPREESDEDLEKRLEAYISKVDKIETALFNFHAPPYQSKLDEAPLLDEDFKPVIRAGKVVMVPVGSMAVRKVIEEHQPQLGLHGHIHEAGGSMKIGKTFCVNPGSEYSEGVLRAFFIEFRDKEIRRLQRIEG
jgi:Icc-related predicted phosphoesterase